MPKYANQYSRKYGIDRPEKPQSTSPLYKDVGTLGTFPRPGFLTDDAIRQFQEAYTKDFGKEIEFEKAALMAARLVTLLLHVSRPLPGKPEAPPASQA